MKSTRLRREWILKCCLALAGFGVMVGLSKHLVYAQLNPATWSVQPSKLSLARGERFTAAITARIQSGWHIYSMSQPSGGPVPTSFKLSADEPFSMSGEIKAPQPHSTRDESFGITTETYQNTVRFAIPLETSALASPGQHRVQVTVRFQACNGTLCLPPRTVTLAKEIDIAESRFGLSRAVSSEPAEPSAAGSTKTELKTPERASSQADNLTPPIFSTSPRVITDVLEAESAPNPAASEARQERPKSETPVQSSQPPVASYGPGLNSNQSLLSFLWLAISIAALSLLTPCVFPMVPITVSYFTSHGAASRMGAFRNALVYSIGIIVTFTGLGMALALLAGAAGMSKFASNPWINLLIAVVFFSFAMNLIGAFQIQVPSSLLTKLDNASRREGRSPYAGMILMGLTFSLTSFTCTVPFVGTLLVMAARGNWAWPLLGMLAYSSVFSLPFFVLALLPQLVSQLPKSGGWLNSVKVVMGMVEIAAAMKFLSNVDLVWRWGIFTRGVVLAVWIALALMITIYLLGKFQLAHDSSVERLGAIRLSCAVVFLATAFYLLTGLFGQRLGELDSFLPPASAELASAAAVGTTKVSAEQEWIANDYQAALDAARKEKKLVFVDFTGYTCTNCRWMESNIFPMADVQSALSGFIRVKLYTDGEGEIYRKNQKLQETTFGTVALPFYAVVDASGRPVSTFQGLTRNPAEFLGFLKEGSGALRYSAKAMEPRGEIQ